MATVCNGRTFDLRLLLSVGYCVVCVVVALCVCVVPLLVINAVSTTHVIEDTFFSISTFPKRTQCPKMLDQKTRDNHVFCMFSWFDLNMDSGWLSRGKVTGSDQHETCPSPLALLCQDARCVVAMACVVTVVHMQSHRESQSV